MMGRDKRNEGRSEHWTKMIRPTMETPAWRALSCYAQALYPWLKFEWKGPQANNNGRIALSIRQAADRLGVSKKTAAKAFHELQAKGFVVVKKAATLGTDGAAKSSEFEITELAMPGQTAGRRLFADWRPGGDFPVAAVRSNNPHGVNGRAPGAGNVVRLRGGRGGQI
jgi:hypothetical protein